MKKNKNNSSVDFIEQIIDLLLYEKYINYKKLNNLQLSKNEKFFDDFIISPSFVLRFLLERNKKI